MEKEKKIELLRQNIKAYLGISKKELIEIGFSEYEISNLLNSNNIIRTGRGIYRFKNVNYEYLFKENVFNGNYEVAFDFYKLMTENRQSNDYNFYLYLFNYILDLDDEYKDKANNLRYKDIKIDDCNKDYKNNKRQNDIRKLILRHDFNNLEKLLFIRDNKQEYLIDILVNHTIKSIYKSRKENKFDKNLIQNKYKCLNSKNVISLLGNMNDKRIKNISRIVDKYIDLDMFIINKNEIVLRKIISSDNYQKVSKEAHLCYKNKNYKKCIELYLEMIAHKRQNSLVYARLGISYYYENNIKQAIKYLTIAKGLNKGRNKEYELLLNNIKNNSNSVNNPFCDELNNECVNKLTDMIKNNGISLYEISKSYMIYGDELAYLSYLLAQKFYYNENVELADTYLNYALDNTKDEYLISLIEKNKLKTRKEKVYEI